MRGPTGQVRREEVVEEALAARLRVRELVEAVACRRVALLRRRQPARAARRRDEPPLHQPRLVLLALPLARVGGGARQRDRLVVEHRPEGEEGEADQLEGVEALAREGQPKGPHANRPHRVEHHAVGSAGRLCDCDADRVEDRDRACVGGEEGEHARAVVDLGERVDGILHRVAVRARRVLQHDEKAEEAEEAPQALAADGEEGGHIVAGDEALLDAHLCRDEELRQHHQRVAAQPLPEAVLAVRRRGAAGLGRGH
mmetsp:Transcript_12583/g.40130  ORF Transcript_12583/g.40130 Transcript_12583/m.40130 type:complete len:256 (+) Transcript_12583:234-1001(+)